LNFLQPLEKLGIFALDKLAFAGRMGIFFALSLKSLILPPYKFWPVINQINFIGSKSVFVIMFTGAFTGMVLALQGYYALRQYGSEGAIGSAVGLSLIRELGPVLTALMVTGRAGSAICAEIGIMRNSEQIDALECMAIDPFKYLIVPKFIGAIICLPLLTSLFDVIGVYGGYIIAVKLLGVNEGAYFLGMSKSVIWDDITMGIIKSFCFAVIIIWVCAGRGYFLHFEKEGFGAEGVSRVTTKAVVMSSVLILVWDYLITSILI